jgi:hypothetical protein
MEVPFFIFYNLDQFELIGKHVTGLAHLHNTTLPVLEPRRGHHHCRLELAQDQLGGN